MASDLPRKNLVLVGGGHSHAIALKLWGMNPLNGVNLTLITDVTHTPYSGMLPGYIAGYYSYSETHIDLSSLAKYAKADLILGKAIGLDLEKNQVICENHPPVFFDLLSIDIGSTPDMGNIPGAKQCAVGAKPVPIFLEHWHKIVAAATHFPENPISIAIVGGGAGGVELALNMHYRLQNLSHNFTINLFHKLIKLLPNHNDWISKRLENILCDKGINLYLRECVKEITPLPIKSNSQEYMLRCDSGLTVKSDYVFWVTQASAPSWLKASGLTTDPQGFILVKDTLQSISQPHVFAAGDVATMVHYPRPKAGVFAVRQGQPLFDNLQRFLQGKRLKSYHPQSWYLSLIGTGDKQAIASWGWLGYQSALLWKWKEHIDRKFMQKFDNF